MKKIIMATLILLATTIFLLTGCSTPVDTSIAAATPTATGGTDTATGGTDTGTGGTDTGTGGTDTGTGVDIGTDYPQYASYQITSGVNSRIIIKYGERFELVEDSSKSLMFNGNSILLGDEGYVVLVMPDIESIVLHGQSTVELYGFNSKRISLYLDGETKLTASDSWFSYADISLHDSSFIDLCNIKIETINLVMDGKSEACLIATASLSGSLSEYSNLKYDGSPMLELDRSNHQGLVNGEPVTLAYPDHSSYNFFIDGNTTYTMRRGDKFDVVENSGAALSFSKNSVTISSYNSDYITIMVPNISSITTREKVVGSLEDFSLDNLIITLSDNGSLKVVNSKIAKLIINASGSSHNNFQSSYAQYVEVDLRGNSTTELGDIGSIKGKKAGSSALSYFGKPDISIEKN